MIRSFVRVIWSPGLFATHGRTISNWHFPTGCLDRNIEDIDPAPVVTTQGVCLA